MRPRNRFGIAAAGVAFAALLASATAAGDASIAPDKAAIEAIIHDYLLAHPEVLVEALEKFQQQQEQLSAELQTQAIIAHRDALTQSPDTPVLGNPTGDVTVVEFFDYNCPYCKTVAAGTLDTLEQDGNVRIVLKEFPILGDGSVYASRAALAAQRQGKYRELHLALMAHKGKIDAEAVRNLVSTVGLDWAKLEMDMQDPAIDAAIARNDSLAASIGVRGTPAFIIGDQLIPGAIEIDDLKKRIAAERQG